MTKIKNSAIDVERDKVLARHQRDPIITLTRVKITEFDVPRYRVHVNGQLVGTVWRNGIAGFQRWCPETVERDAKLGEHGTRQQAVDALIKHVRATTTGQQP